MRAFLAGMLAAGALVATAQAAEQPGAEGGAALGERVYQANCAVCHGKDGTGGGPYAELLTTALPDLTTLSQRNDGAFPYERVRQIIDGRAEVAAHGTRDMPIWGEEFSRSAVDYYQDFYTRAQAEAFVSGRILALMDHLRGLQK